jgi:hypothetical protein
MRTFLCFLVLAVLACVAVAADVDVTGKWSGTFNVTGPDGDKDGTAILNLKQSGSDISGSVGPSEDEQFPIQKGTIEGNKITLEADHGGHIMKIDLVLADDRITGEAHMDAEGQTLKAKIDVSRAK